MLNSTGRGYALRPMASAVFPSAAKTSSSGQTDEPIFLYEISDLNINEPDIRQLILLYSKYKFGCRTTISLFSEQLARLIIKQLGLDFESNKDKWVVVTSQFNEMPSSSHAVSIEVAKLLGISFVTPRVTRKDDQAVSYAGLSTIEERLESRQRVGVYFNERDSEILKGRKAIVIDDLINSGATVQNIRNILKENHAVNTVYIFSVISLKSENLSLESIMNNDLIKKEEMTAVISILSDPNTAINRTSLKSLFNLDFDIFEKIIQKLSYHKLIKIRDIAKDYYDHGLKQEKLERLMQEISERECVGSSNKRENQAKIARIVNDLIRYAVNAKAPTWMVYGFRPGLLQVDKDVIKRKVDLAYQHLEKADCDQDCKERIKFALKILAYQSRKLRISSSLFEGITNTLIKLLSGDKDAYVRIKESLDESAQKVYETLRMKLIEKSVDQKDVLRKLMIYSGTMNLLDVSNPHTLEEIAQELGFDIAFKEGTIDPGAFEIFFANTSERVKLLFDEFDKFYEVLEKNPKGTLLYFLDNHGEVIIDQLVLEQLLRLSGQYRVVVVARGETVREDVAFSEAKQIIYSNPNLKKFVKQGRLSVVTDGSYCLGADLRQAFSQPDFIKSWSDSFAFIAKGGGNFQSLFGQELSRPGFFIRMMKSGANGLGYRLLSNVRQLRLDPDSISKYNQVLLFQPRSQMYDIQAMIERKLIRYNIIKQSLLTLPPDIDSLYNLVAKATHIYNAYGDFDIRIVGNVWSITPPEKDIRMQIERLDIAGTESKVKEVLDAITLDIITIKGESVDILDNSLPSGKSIGSIDRNIAEYCNYIHMTADAFVLTPDLKRIILIRRAHNQKQYPFCLTTPGGHLHSEQASYEKAIIDELKEELCLDAIQGRLREVGQYSYGFNDKLNEDSTKERRKLFVYQLTEEEYAAIKSNENVLKDIGKEGFDSFTQWLEARQAEGAGEVFSYHEVTLDQIENAKSKNFTQHGTVYKNTRFLVLKDVVTGEDVEIFFTPDLLNHIISNSELLTKTKMVIEDLRASRSTDAYFVEVHPTNRCNLNCKGCVYESCNRDANAVETLPFEYLEKIALLNPSFVKIVGGGEPTIYRDSGKDFNNFVLRLRELLPKTSIGLTTNGTFIPRGSWQYEVSWVSISVHGYSSESFNEFTGSAKKDMFERVLNNAFIYYSESPIPDIRLKFVYSEDNILNVIILARRFFERWQSAIATNGDLLLSKKLEFILQPYAEDEKPGDPFTLSNISQDKLEAYREQLKDAERDPEFWDFITTYAPDLLTRPFTIQIAPCVHKCWMASKYVLLGADGIFYPCCIMAGVNRQHNLGSADQSIKELLKARWKMFHNPPIRCELGCRPVNTYTGRMIGQMLQRENIVNDDREMGSGAKEAAKKLNRAFKNSHSILTAA